MGLILGGVSGVINLIPFIGPIIGALIGLAEIVVGIMLAIAASRGKAVRIPFLGTLNIF